MQSAMDERRESLRRVLSEGGIRVKKTRLTASAAVDWVEAVL